MDKVSKLEPWEVHEFPWGVAIKHRYGRWEKVILHGGQEMDLSKLTHFNISLDETGMEFERIE